MNANSITITTECHEGRRRYLLTSDTLKTEVLSPEGESVHSDSVSLSQLSDEISIHPTGSYVTKPLLFAALSLMPVVVIMPVLLPSSRIQPVHLFIGFGVWFFSWVVFGARRDVCFWIYTRDGKDVVRVVGRSRQQEQLHGFVRRVTERVKELDLSEPDG
jgi:hypothetical protein